MIRIDKKYDINFILDKVMLTNPNDKISKKEAKIDLDGDTIKFNSHRLQTFKMKGIKCVKCCIKGKYFIKEKNSEEHKSYHLNLYALDKNNNEVLMTKDHIIPIVKGGKDNLENFQTMCTHCNQEKDCSGAEDNVPQFNKNKLSFIKRITPLRYGKKLYTAKRNNNIIYFFAENMENAKSKFSNGNWEVYEVEFLEKMKYVLFGIKIH